MRLDAIHCAGFSSTADRLRIHYRVAGAAGRPNDALAHIDIAESDDEVFVSLFEAVGAGNKHLAGVGRRVDLPVALGARVVRDGNAPHDDERRGARQYLRGRLVPRRPVVDGVPCHDWTTARSEACVGPQKWPHGTVHRRLLPPLGDG